MTDQELDTLMRRVLVDAIALETQDMPEDDIPYEPSAKHQRQVRAMLANPLGWVRKRARPVWKKALQRVAVVALTISLSFAGVMAVSPTVRATVVHWVTEWYETYIVYRFFDELVGDQLVPMPEYRIAKLPAGYSEDGSLLELPNDSEIRYKSETGEIIRFEYMRMHQGSQLMVSTENMVVSDVMVDGCPGQVYISTDPEQSNAIVWIDEDAGLQFLIDGFTEEAILLQMAESVSLVKQ